MKAVIYDKNNKPDMFTVLEIEKPTQNDDQVLVKIMAASINAADYRSLSIGNVPKSRIFGADIAGVVEAVGKNIKLFKAGDEVFADILGAGFGGLAEYVAVPERFLASKPAGISFTDTASLPIAALTALQGLRDLGKIQAGHRVLIHGAAGGVGTFAVQLAKNFGAKVTAVCSTRNVDMVKFLGADCVIDYTKEDYAKTGERFNMIFAVNGKRPLATYLRTLLPGGRLIVAGGAFSQIFSTMFFGPLLSMGDKKVQLLSAKPNRNDLEFLAKLVEEGKLKPVIEKIYSIDEAPKAMHYLMKGHARGKVVINVAQE